MKGTQSTKANHPSKNGVIIADGTVTVFPNVDKISKTIKINLPKQKEPNKSFYQYVKKDQNLPKKNVYSIISSGKPPSKATKSNLEINHHITLVKEVDHPNKEIHEISHKIDIVDRIVETTIHDRIHTQHNLFQHPVPIQTQEIDTISTTDHEISSYNRNRNYSNNRNISYSNNRNQNYPNNR